LSQALLLIAIGAPAIQTIAFRRPPQRATSHPSRLNNRSATLSEVIFIWRPDRTLQFNGTMSHLQLGAQSPISLSAVRIRVVWRVFLGWGAM
jgi:hypothetical protein